MFSTDKLTMIYGDRVLFQDVTLHFHARRRYGLVGANGAGKTTFLKILKGKQPPTSGIVQIPKDAKVGILDQDYFRFGNKKILDIVLMGDNELWKALEKKEKLLKKGEMTSSEIESLSEIEELITRKGGYRAESRAAQLLSGLGIDPKRHEDKLNTLSGGYKLRVLLSQVLYIEPEILLLDEPTNYLDIFSIRWLERYLCDYPGTLILSSHDRFFLNQVCQEIIDIDYGEMRRYVGNFDHFLDEKKKEVVFKEAQLESLAKRKKDMQRFIDRFKAKASKARQASARERMIEKLEEEEMGYQIFPSSRQYPHFHFPIHRPSGRQALTMKNIDKAFGEHSVLKGISFEVLKQEKIAIVGPNGMGKSTLLEILTDHLEADQGSYRWGPHTKWSYFPQDFHRTLSDELTLYDWLTGVSKEIPEQKVRQTLGKMLFDEQDIHKKVRSLSGGEAARLVFARIMLSDQNILILDEPTNHLDMESVDALVKGLKEYEGTLIIVSHNRYFISEVANRIIEILPIGINDFNGGYEEFVEKHEKDYLDQVSIKSEKGKKKISERKEERKERNRLKREIENLEREIERSEKEIEEIHLILSAPNFYDETPPNKLQEILNQKDRLEKHREKILNQWEDKQEEFDSRY
ncbi:MAG: ABC-F family ATP-binding cassette domain-containing protein [Chlamydiia bacterium]|nr:ABC-F family ATP-binding cassette domain-containing protein [Chlamydiia bacterium]